MAKKLNSMPDYQARMPRQPHDMSQSITLSFSTGMELPVYYDMLYLGDDIYANVNMFCRLQNPLTATLADIDIHFDYFFVPLSVLFTPAPSMFYQTDDLVSNLFVNNSNPRFQDFPLVSVDESLRSIKNDAPHGVNSNQQRSDSKGVKTEFYNGVFDCWGKAAYRLCDFLDLSARPLFGTDDNLQFNPNITPWFLCAYHACHELFYRNDDREGKSYLYNFDSYFNSPIALSNNKLFTLNYVSRYKDYFNAVKVSPIGSSVSMLGDFESWELLSRVNSYLYNNESYSRLTAQGSSDVIDSDSTTVGSASSLSINAANIRQLFMVDKLLRVTGRANKDYESQFLAHFGVKIPHDVLHNITHIGHDMCTLRCSPVQSTADTYNATTDQGRALGEIGGNGVVSLNGKKFHFHAPCHGVFMVILHSQPKIRYFAGISKLHDLSSPDKFWQPEYDRKGMQPIFGYETTRDDILNTERVGWQFAYEQFKRKYDKVTTAYKDIYGVVDVGSVNFYSPWVLAARPYAHPGTGYMNHGDDFAFADMNFTDWLATPHDLDPMMTIKYQSTWIDNLTYANSHLLFQTDPFIADFRMDCYKVNFMSEFGEPELD